jgi:DNA-binding NtrC family response regulator
MQASLRSDTPESRPAHRHLVCGDPTSRSLLELLTRLAPGDIPVLIHGESGTGKDAVARYLHEAGNRRGLFIAIDCGAIDVLPQDPRESWFEAAHQGTLFLDEIGHLPLNLQARLVSILGAQRTMTRAEQPAMPDVRLVTATAQSLVNQVAAGSFRPDLFYRLNIAEVALLPLRHRVGDIAPLADHFIRSHARRLNRRPPVLSTEASAALARHCWPGNVRELENVIRLALLLAPAQTLERDHLKLQSLHATGSEVDSSDVIEEPLAQKLTALLTRYFHVPGVKLLDHFEGQVIAEAFRFTGRNQVRTAALLGITRNVLRTLLRKHKLYDIRAYGAGATPTDGESP